MALTIPLAVEKVLFRLALLAGGKGSVSLARVFLELPLSLEEVEQCADKVANGTSVVKNEWGDSLCYEFPELSGQSLPVPDDCPGCGGTAAPPPTEAGAEVRAPILCDPCYRETRLQSGHRDKARLERLKAFFLGAEDPLEVARTEHEIFFIGLQLGEQFTHSVVAAQSRLPANTIKEQLDRMASRRYIQVGLLPSGDAVGYRFPPGLSYPKVHYRRLLDEPATRDARAEPKGPAVKDAGDGGIKIVIKGRRNRGSR